MLSEGVILDVAREAFMTIIITSAPPLLVSLVIGLIVSIFQTVTSIQEQTLTFLPKLLSIFLMIILIGNWIMNNIAGFMTTLIQSFSQFIQ